MWKHFWLSKQWASSFTLPLLLPLTLTVMINTSMLAISPLLFPFDDHETKLFVVQPVVSACVKLLESQPHLKALAPNVIKKERKMWMKWQKFETIIQFSIPFNCYEIDEFQQQKHMILFCFNIIYNSKLVTCSSERFWQTSLNSWKFTEV